MLKKISFAALLLLMTVGPLQADEIKVNPNQPDSYVVQKGDTLWDISSQFSTGTMALARKYGRLTRK